MADNPLKIGITLPEYYPRDEFHDFRCLGYDIEIDGIEILTDSTKLSQDFANPLVGQFRNKWKISKLGVSS